MYIAELPWKRPKNQELLWIMMFVSSKLQYDANEWQMHVLDLGLSYFIPHEFLIRSRGEFLILSRGEKKTRKISFACPISNL